MRSQSATKVAPTPSESVSSFKSELKNLKRAFLGSSGSNASKESVNHYSNRSAQRRKLHGTTDLPIVLQGDSSLLPASSSSLKQQQLHVQQHLYRQRFSEETKPSSSLSQSQSNSDSRVGGVGESMLEKLGWKQGTGLGKHPTTGLRDPSDGVNLTEDAQMWTTTTVFVLAMAIISACQTFYAAVSEILRRRNAKKAVKWQSPSIRFTTFITCGCIGLIITYTCLFLKLQVINSKSNLAYAESVGATIGMSIAQVCYVQFIWLRAKSILSPVLSEKFILFLQYLVYFSPLLLSLQVFPKIAEWVARGHKIEAIIVKITTALVIAIASLLMTLDFALVYVFVVQQNSDGLSRETKVIAKYGIASTTLATLGIATIAGNFVQTSYYYLIRALAYATLNMIFLTFTLMMRELRAQDQARNEKNERAANLLHGSDEKALRKGSINTTMGRTPGNLNTILEVSVAAL
ncbi:hypothetical protein BDR26DRAFT_1006162 [Obelidium mucronatum]|nr:hypothetical protein BDR26DRAFT_1006162 [Obelidium mucronatum]